MNIHPRPDQELAIKDAIRAGLISFLPFGKRLQAGAGSVIFTGGFTKNLQSEGTQGIAALRAVTRERMSKR